MATNPSVSASATSGGDNDDDKSRFILPGVIGIVCLLVGLILGYAFWNSSKDLDRLKAANTSLAGELSASQTKVAELEKRKPTEIISGITPEQCTKMADDIVGKSCVGKTATKTVTKWRERPHQHAYVPRGPALPAPNGSADWLSSTSRTAKALDRCIFRVKGEIKAETFVENGEVNCPIWRDVQMVRFNQKPTDLLEVKKYPTNSPQ